MMVNCIPSLAYAASDVPILGDIVRVVTFGRFEVQEENYEAKVTTPKIEGLMNADLEKKLNDEIAENANTVIAAFEKDKKTGTIITLKSLFKKNAEYVTPISNYIVEEMKKVRKKGQKRCNRYGYIASFKNCPLEHSAKAKSFLLNLVI